ncbi:hypothetical protein [Sphaerisporangium sp. TRM90804]|uniref:hypothetical protein n=1 Tax=Sphaerisporangium sp. TRM90804 TaxID=3031113 RepID=UPI00244AD439|nr:hypothetical protein [Sphaerisporangium sp. TRM90804]MDH2425654.1 hypothetical protein [Sphaerisporangium sp. TRM90804]
MAPGSRPLALIAVTLLLQAAVCAAAFAEGGSEGSRPGHRKAGGTIGIRLLEASSNRRDDPRAQIYVVDHINPGTTIHRRLEISNTSRIPQRVAVFVGAAEIRGNKFKPARNRNANELASWISVDSPALVVPANGRVPVKATIAIPEGASKGERYGAIWAETASELKPGSRRNVAVVNRVGVRIYLDVGPGGDPPTDFRVKRLTPGRIRDGTPVVRATVQNTGERAIDVEGRIWLSDGPGGLKAGPTPVQVGTTLAPGDEAPVMAVLDARLPDGPWRVKLTLESGRVRRTITGTLTFPAKGATWGQAALLDSTPWMYVAAGALAAALVAGLGIVLLRRVRRPRRRAG